MKKQVIRKKHAGDKNHKMSKDLLKEEFGPELGDINAFKAYENAIEAKNQKEKPKKK